MVDLSRFSLRTLFLFLPGLTLGLWGLALLVGLRERGFGHAMKVEVALLAASAVLVVVAALWVSSWIRSRIASLMSLASDIEHKRLVWKEQVQCSGGNEVCRVIELLRTVMEDYRTFLKRIQEGICTVANTSREVASVVSQSVAHSREAFDNVRDLVSHVEGLRERSQEISESLGQLTEAVNEISRNAAETSSDSEEANQRVEEASEVLGRLIGEVEGIRSSAEEIQKIAEQTNLLALNATIEAARAGEAGKGFAVVAGEVKELSRSSGELAAQISERVEALVRISQEMRERMDTLLQAIGRTRERTISVASAVEEQTAVISEIHQTVTSFSETFAQLDRISGEIDRRTREAEKGTGKLKEESETLLELSGTLQEEVNRYDVGTRFTCD